MSDCKHLASCPVWEKLNSNIKFAWINSYCKGTKQDDCARKELKESGQKVPITLMPNNEHLPERIFI